METREYIRHRILKRPYRLTVRVDEGRGTPVILLHGLASSSDAWTRLVRLADLEKWRIIALDLLGFGQSPKPEWVDYSVEQHVRAVAGSLKRLKLKQPVIIVGHSMGCIVAIRMAAKYPKLVRKIILYEPPIFIDSPQFPAHTRNRKRYFALYQRIANNPKAVIRYTRSLGKIAARLPGHNLSSETWLPFERSLRNTIMKQTAYAELLNLTLPIDIVYGRLDIVVPRNQFGKLFLNKANIMRHKVIESHWVSTRSAKFLLSLFD